MSRPSYATENWLRTQLRLRDERIAELTKALKDLHDACVGSLVPQPPGTAWLEQARRVLDKAVTP